MATNSSLRTIGTSSQYAAITDGSQTGLEATSFTLMGWVKVDSGIADAGDKFLMGKWAANVGYLIGLENSGYMFAHLGASSVGNQNATYADHVYLSRQLDDGIWHHVALTYDGTTAKIYIDGMLSADKAIASASLNGSADFRLSMYSGDTRYTSQYISQVRYYNAVLTQATIVSEAFSTATGNANLVSYWSLDSTANDSKGSNHLTLYGSPVYAVDIPWQNPAAAKSTAYALNLTAASSQYASIADAAALRPGNVTVEAWFQCSSTGTRNTIIDKGALGGDYAIFIESGTLKVRVRTSGTDKTVTVLSTVPLGVWLHAALVYDGSTLYGYLNGVLAASVSATGTYNTTTSTLNIGQRADGGDFFDGKIRDVRIFSDVRTQTEIVTDAITKNVSDVNLVAEWNFNNAYTDSSGNGRTVTASGSPTFKQLTNKITGALVSWWTMDETSGNRADSHGSNTLTDNNTVLYGTGKQSNAADFESTNSEFFSAADSATLSLGSAFSLALWVKPESTPASTAGQALIDKGDADVNGSKEYSIYYYNDAGTYKIIAFLSSDGTAAADAFVTMPSALSTSTFTHLVLTYNAGALKLYLNGVLTGEGTSTVTSIKDGTGTFHMGAKTNSASQNTYADGMFDEVALFSAALDYGQILDLYNAGSGIPYVYTAPAASLTDALMFGHFA